MINCEICKKELKNYVALSQHVKIHNIKSREYFERYPRQYKRCYKCGLTKCRDKFYIDKYFNDCLSALCKECMRAKINLKHSTEEWKKYKAKYDRKYSIDNYDKIINRHKEYRRLNKDKRNKYNRERYKNFPEIFRRANKRYEQTDKGRHMRKKQVERYQKTEKGKETMYRNNMKRRERINKLCDKISKEDIKRIKTLFNNNCFRCNGVDRLAIDHFYPLSKGHGLLKPEFNACLLCINCNSRKSDKVPSEFFTKQELSNYHIIKSKWR